MQSLIVGVSGGAPRLEAPAPQPGRGRPRSRPLLAPGVTAVTVADLAAQVPARAWRTVSWRNGPNRPWRARFWACRVTPAHDWRERRVAPEVWLLCQRYLGDDPETKYYLVHLPITASLKALVRLSHQRWAIEQQYQELKTELGLDHFEGRSYPGWQRHVALTAIAYAFLPAGAPAARPVRLDVSEGPGGEHRDPDRPLLDHASAVSRHHAETQGDSATKLTR